MADFAPARQSQAPSAGQQNQDVPPTIPAGQHAPPAPANPPQPPAASPSSGRRPRGRPRGSKNKSKPPVLIAEEYSTTRHIQLVIPAGCHLITTLENYAKQHQIGIHVVGGFGTVGNVMLRNPLTILPGFHNLLALAGTYMDPSMYTGSVEGTFPSYILGGSVPWLTIFTSGSTEHIVTRSVAVAQVLTVTDVVVNIITFKTFEIQTVDPAVIAFPELSPSPTGSMSGGGGGTSGGNAQMGGGSMPAPGFGLPGGGQLNFMPSMGVSYRPPKIEPNYC